jgi:hypothetical protein
MRYLGSIGTFFQSFSEARAAAAPVFRQIDAVNFSQLRSHIDSKVLFLIA